MSAKATGYVFLALAMIIVGSTVVASKVIAAGLPPFTATAARFALAFPIFITIMHVTRTRWPRPDRRDRVLLILQAGAGSVGYTVLLIAGLRLTPAINGGVIAGTLPAVSAMFAILVLGERPRWTTLTAIALATLGVAMITVRGNGSFSLSSTALLGNALVFGAVVCEAVFILLNKRLRVPLAPLPQSTLMCGIGLAVAIVPALVERPWLTGASQAAVMGVAYYALVPTVIGFLLWYAGAARVSGGEASLFTAFLPVSAVVLATTVLGETIAVAQLAGIACVLGAVILTTTGEMVSRQAGRRGQRNP